MSQKYNIKSSSSNTVGYQLADGDKIYFAPAGIGCGQLTKYSGIGDTNWTWDHDTNTYINSGTVDRRWRTIAEMICTSVDSSTATVTCDADYDGIYDEQCAVDTMCDPTNPSNGGCGATGVCEASIVSTSTATRTQVLSISGFSATTFAAEVETPAALTTVQNMVACFATQESVAGHPHDVTDFVMLQDGLEVIDAPRLGPVGSPGNVHAVENSSPSFTVNTMKYGDLIYFVPKTQTDADNSAGTSSDCIPTVCTLVGGSSISATCDATYDGSYTDTCVLRARCNPSNDFNGGCGTDGQCEQVVPGVTASWYTTLLNGTAYDSTSSTGKIFLPSVSGDGTTLSVPPNAGQHTTLDSDLPVPAYISAWHLAACFVPAGAIQTLPSNVQPLQDMLTVIKEPIESLVSTGTSWFQNHVQELRFTQPQQGNFGQPSFATGLPGDMVVLKKDNCTGAHTVTAASFDFNSYYSARFTLEEAGYETTGDEKGGTATVIPLATGKVNELSPGIYKVCYATKMSEGDDQSDYKELAETIEILPPPATTPRLTVPRTVLLGQDLVVNWEANVGLQTRVAPENTWIGLYVSDDCSEETEWRHKCYRAFQFLPAGAESGTVRFSQSDYKTAGDFDIRYFAGDTRNGQGELCKGLTGVEHETYVQCLLNPAVTSSSIHIHGPDLRDLEDLESQPGMEVVFSGNQGRFN
jgi:hypothetical protein